MSEEVVTDLTRGVYRRLYSGFTKGQRINKLSLQAEAWFWRVVATVDDFGNGDADPDLCRDATAGRRKVTSQQVSGWLGEMRSVGLIQMYNVKGEPYLHVIGFEATQPAGRNGRRIRRVPAPDESEGIQNIPDVVSASDSDTEDDTHTDNESEARAAKPLSPRSPKICDEDFLAELQKREAYKALNVKAIHSKMLTWCEVRGKQPTRGRLVNWLNREDQPMEKRNGTDNELRRPSAAEKNGSQLMRNLAVVQNLRRESRGDSD